MASILPVSVTPTVPVETQVLASPAENKLCQTAVLVARVALSIIVPVLSVMFLKCRAAIAITGVVTLVNLAEILYRFIPPNLKQMPTSLCFRTTTTVIPSSDTNPLDSSTVTADGKKNSPVLVATGARRASDAFTLDPTAEHAPVVLAMAAGASPKTPATEGDVAEALELPAVPATVDVPQTTPDDELSSARVASEQRTSSSSAASSTGVAAATSGGSPVQALLALLAAARNWVSSQPQPPATTPGGIFNVVVDDRPSATAEGSNPTNPTIVDAYSALPSGQ